jgi:hypothetical protein
MRRFAIVRLMLCAALGATGVVVATTPAHAESIYSCGETSFQSVVNGRYVSAELGYTGGNYGMLRARATSIGPWEKFEVCGYTRDGYNIDYETIRSVANGRYVSAELGYTGGNYGMLRARATSIGPWEEFFTGMVDIQSISNGLYVSAELGYTGGNYGMLRARATSVGPWEEFWS